MRSYSALTYVQAGCGLAKKSLSAFLSVHVITHNRVCDTICDRFNNGKCFAYRKLTNKGV